MSKPKVILDPFGRKRDHIFSREDLDRLNSLADVIWGRDEMMPDDQIAPHRGEVEAVIAGHWHHGSLAEFPRLRAFLEVGGGLPSTAEIDYPACFARGIRVLSCGPAFAPAVAEMGLTLALAAARGAAETDRAFRSGTENWSHEDVAGPYLLFDKPVGFVGFGSIARVLKSLLAPFRCPIKVFDPWLTDVYLRSQGVAPASLEELLESSKVVFALAVPTRDNDALLSREKLKLLRKGSLLVILSRAQIVDFEAMTEMTAAGRFQVAVDVFPEEPLALDHPIRRVPSAVLSSHRAGAQTEALQTIGRLVVDDLEAVLRGLPPQFMLSASPEILRLRGL